jgi:hypothetical protein
VVAGAGYAYVFPVRTYLYEQHSIAAEEHALAVWRAEDSKLAAQVSSLSSDATIEQIARQKYGLVQQGQQAFDVLPANPAPAPKTAPMPKHTHWYSYLEPWRYF